jgi:redox-regulated HSP33 family molecular chaperone
MEISCQIGTIIGVSAIIANADPQVAVWTTALTIAGGLILQIMRDRRDDKRYRQDREDRREVARLALLGNKALMKEALDTRDMIEGKPPADVQEFPHEPESP